MENMIFGLRPDFDDVLSEIQGLECEINSLS